MSHQLAITGGNERNQFAVSGNLLKQIGITLGAGLRSQEMRVNYEGQATSRFRVGGSALVVRSLQRLGRGDGLYGEAIADTPLSVPYDSVGNIVFKPTPDAQRDNPLSDVNNWKNDNLRNRVFGTLFATINLADGLDYRVNFGPDMTFNAERHSSSARRRRASRARARTSRSATSKTFDYTLDNLLTYKKQLGSMHKIDATLLYSIEKQTLRGELRLVAEPPVRVGAVLQPGCRRHRLRHQQPDLASGRSSRTWPA